MMKIKSSIYAVVGIIMAFLLPIISLIIIVGIAIGIDTILGVIKAKKLKQRLTSRKLSQIVSKMALYQCALIGCFVLDKYIVGEIINLFISVPLFATKLVACTLLFIELTSILENLKSGFGFDLWSNFKKMLSRAKKVKQEFEDFDIKNENNENETGE